VRSKGAVPATIAILDGVVRVGLTDEELDRLGKLGSRVVKCSRRDIAPVAAKGGNGATTVSGTMLIAHLAGIKVFITGGIGGVHRQGHITMDVSADLTELGRTPVVVVCAGAKSILDIARTLEVLETQGVAVVGYGTDEFPAFFTPNSGCSTSCRVDTAEQAAKLIQTHFALHISSGVLVACPISAEEAAEAAKVERATQQALREMREKNIKGREVTPYLLRQINKLTSGDSLKSNIALVKNNAAIGAEVAVALALLGGQRAPQAKL